MCRFFLFPLWRSGDWGGDSNVSPQLEPPVTAWLQTLHWFVHWTSVASLVLCTRYFNTDPTRIRPGRRFKFSSFTGFTGRFFFFTLSPPTLTLSESGSSAADSGWMISAMGFCPELARPLGAPTLILREGGRTWPGIGCDGGPVLRGSVRGHWAVWVFFLLRSGSPPVGMLTSASWPPTVSWLLQRSCAAPDVDLREPGCKQTRTWQWVANERLELVYGEEYPPEWNIQTSFSAFFTKITRCIKRKIKRSITAAAWVLKIKKKS